MASEKTYWSREICDLLDIKSSTLRKWCLILEKAGYRFLRDEQGRRAYTEHDAIALRQFKELSQNMTLEEAAIGIVSRHNRDSDSSVTSVPAITNPEAMEMVKDLKDKLDRIVDNSERQERFNRELIEKLKEQQQYMEWLMQRQDERIVRSMRKEMEEQKRIAAIEEEEKKKSNFLRRLFNPRE